MSSNYSFIFNTKTLYVATLSVIVMNIFFFPNLLNHPDMKLNDLSYLTHDTHSALYNRLPDTNDNKQVETNTNENNEEEKKEIDSNTTEIKESEEVKALLKTTSGVSVFVLLTLSLIAVGAIALIIVSHNNKHDSFDKCNKEDNDYIGNSYNHIDNEDCYNDGDNKMIELNQCNTDYSLLGEESTTY